MSLRLSVVKSQVRLEGEQDDARLQWCIDHAEIIIIDYLKVAADAFDSVLPFHVEAAMVLVVEQLFDGDPKDDPITPAVVSLLARTRDPALA